MRFWSKKFYKIANILSLAALPISSYAQGIWEGWGGCRQTLGEILIGKMPVDTVRDYVCYGAYLLNRIINLLMIVATIVFLWGAIKYITAAGDEQKLSDAKKIIIYGIIGLFAMFAMWGIVGLIASSFEVTGSTLPSGPDI